MDYAKFFDSFIWPALTLFLFNVFYFTVTRWKFHFLQTLLAAMAMKNIKTLLGTIYLFLTDRLRSRLFLREVCNLEVRRSARQITGNLQEILRARCVLFWVNTRPAISRRVSSDVSLVWVKLQTCMPGESSQRETLTSRLTCVCYDTYFEFSFFWNVVSRIVERNSWKESTKFEYFDLDDKTWRLNVNMDVILNRYLN